MRINVKESIAGVPMLNVRHLLRVRYCFDTEIVAEVLHTNRADAEVLILASEEQGYLERDQLGNQKFWRITLKGGRLVAATAAEPLHRRTAERKLAVEA